MYCRLTEKTDAGFERPDFLICDGKTWYAHSTKAQAHAFEEIEIVNGPSQPGRCINVNESLISYTNFQCRGPLELNVSEKAHRIGAAPIDGLKESRGLQITFHRTIRMPDDDKVHQLPSSLGTFPLYNVGAYAEALPEAIVRDGGVFMPMWQREALWIHLRTENSVAYALRCSIGRINVVSGSQMDEVPGKTANGKPSQDYVVVPGQQWIDGICVAPGVIRQFVAMPRKFNGVLTLQLQILTSMCQLDPVTPLRDRRPGKRSTAASRLRSFLHSKKISGNGSKLRRVLRVQKSWSWLWDQVEP